MHSPLRYTASARRIARWGWSMALVPPVCAAAYALLTGASPDWFRFFVLLALSVPTALGVVALGVLCEISTSLAVRNTRSVKPAVITPLAAE